MVAYDNKLSDTGVKNNVAIDDDRYVTQYDKVSSNPGLKFVEAGALCFQRHVFESLPAGQVISLEQSLFSRLIAKRELHGFVTTQRFFDIGTPDNSPASSQAALIRRGPSRLKPIPGAASAT